MEELTSANRGTCSGLENMGWPIGGSHEVNAGVFVKLLGRGVLSLWTIACPYPKNLK